MAVAGASSVPAMRITRLVVSALAVFGLSGAAIGAVTPGGDDEVSPVPAAALGGDGPAPASFECRECPEDVGVSAELGGPGGPFRSFAHGWARGRHIVGPDVRVVGMSMRDPVRLRIEVRDRVNHKRVGIFYLVSCIGPGVTWQRSDDVSIDPPVTFSFVPPVTVDYCMVDVNAGHELPGFVSVRSRAAY